MSLNVENPVIQKDITIEEATGDNDDDPFLDEIDPKEYYLNTSLMSPIE